MSKNNNRFNIIKTASNLHPYIFFIGFFVYAVCLRYLSVENMYIGLTLIFLPITLYVLLESISPRNPLIAVSNVIIGLVAFFVGLGSGSKGANLNSLDNLIPAIILICIGGSVTLVLSVISQIIRKKFGFTKYVPPEYKKQELVVALGIGYLLGAVAKVYSNWKSVVPQPNLSDVNQIAIYLSIICWIILGIFLKRKSKWAKVTAGILGFSYYLLLIAIDIVPETEFYAISQILRPPFLELCWFLGISSGGVMLTVLGLHLLSLAHPEPLAYFFSRQYIEQHKINEFASAWNSLCNFKEKRNLSSEIGESLKLLESDRAKARAKLEKMASEYPVDSTVIHCLAVMHYWDIKSGKEINDVVWKGFIAYWVSLMYNEEFWKEWKKEREQFYFENKIEIEEMDELRHFILEMIEEKVPDSYKGDLLLEKRTASTIQRLNEWGMEIGMTPLRLICGPIMLRRLKIEDKFKTMITLGNDKFSYNSDFENLMLYLSPFGLATIFIEEKNIEKAFYALDEIRTTEIPEIFRKKYVDTVIEIAEQQRSLDKVNILRHALQRIEDKVLKIVLFNECKQIANEFANMENWDQAVEYFEIALEIEPNNTDIKNQLDVVKLLKKFGKEVLELLSQARQAVSNKNWDSAIERYRRALKRAEDKRLGIKAIKEIKCELAGVINAKAVGNANKVINRLNRGSVSQSEAIMTLEEYLSDLEEANSLCPENETIRQNLKGIRTSIANLKGEYSLYELIDDKNISKILEELMKGRYKGRRW